ncbi:hypothetical protein E4U32_001241 [Claviceps aff. humidiphila group G2b]|nr:hypothetical protein E4U32_001241 [Claviceps aff. humidiphila group G2b]
MDINSEIDAPDSSELFSVISGGCVRYGEYQFAQRHYESGISEVIQRHCEFNVSELARRAAQAVQADRCLSIKKYPDGMYNRTLLLTMDNGKEVVAKVPNPNAGQPHLTTASEVATMKFVREVLSTDVPQVYDWSSKAQETPVGAEFILMEKLNGMELEEVWPDMDLQGRLDVVKAVAAYQESWASVSFEQFGSLYFAEDFKGENVKALVYTDENGRRVEDSRFVVGSSTSRLMFDDGRDGIDFDRGPWNSLEDYHTAIGNREIACVQQVPHLPSSYLCLSGPGLYQPTREKKVTALQTYLKLLKYILPTDRSLGSSHLWHSDLHAGNVLVDPGDRTRIVGIIDWQSTELSPLYFHARQPPFIDHIGPQLHGLERQVLPPDYDQLKGNAKEAATSLYCNQALCSMYRGLLYYRNPKVFKCLEFQQSLSFGLLLLARAILNDGEAAYLAVASELEEEWETLPGAQGIAYPLTFSPKERQMIQEDLECATVAREALQRLKDRLDETLPAKGVVLQNELKEKKDAFSEAMDQVISEVEIIRSKSDAQVL